VGDEVTRRRCFMLRPLRIVLGMALLLLSVGPAFAETVDTAWVRRYNGTGDSSDYAYAITVDASRNVCVTGESMGSGTGYDLVTMKYRPDGDTAWVRRYNGPGNDSDFGFAIVVDGSDNVCVTGQIKGSGTGSDYATVKYYSDGDTAWLRSYNGPGNGTDYALAIAVDGSGNVYVTGQSTGSGTNYDYATIKYTPEGDTAWVRRYNGPGNSLDNAQAIAVDDSGYVYVTGYSVGDGTHNDYATIKYHSNGDTAWVRRYHRVGQTQERPSAIAVDDSGNVYVTGNGEGATDYDYLTVKYYPDGDTAWLRRYDGPVNGSDYATAIAVDDSGYVYVAGSSEGTGTYHDYVTIKYDPAGNQVWVRRYDYGVSGSDKAYDMAIDGSSSVYVTGHSGGGGTVSFDYATIKYLSNGDTAWVMRYNGPASGSDYAQAIAVDDSGNVCVTGYSDEGSGTDNDFCTIKYVQTSSGVKDETGDRERPSEFVLSQNYPNPFNPSTKIKFTLAKSGFVVLQIYDTLGRKVRNLVSEELSSGYKSVIWDGRNDEGKDVASGVYFYQLKVGDLSEPKKMLLLK
jgi:hypothetical protein